ncbi:MAG: Stp1/IreP family PP2C-type Ser/Thr phosphatase [bacterium]
MPRKKTKFRVKCTASGLTDIGKYRSNNEDAYCILNNKRSVTHLYAVADGMGGHAAGEVASSITIKDIEGFFTSIGNVSVSVDSVENVINQINKHIYDTASTNPEFLGMGNTLSLLVIKNHKFVIGHVGDSRIYRVRGKSLEQLTIDQTEVQAMIDAGQISKEAARHHPFRNLIRQAMGVQPILDEIFLLEGEVLKKDQYLLCSDGLTDMLEDGEIKKILQKSESTDDAVTTLVNKALEAGGRDNVTAIVVRID